MKSLGPADGPALEQFFLDYKDEIPELHSYLGPEMAQSLMRGIVAQASGQQIQALIFFQDLGEEIEVLLSLTAPPFRRQGLMRALLTALYQQRAKTIWLEVSEFNQPARSLYSELGFIQVGARPNYYCPGESALLLSWPWV